MKPVTAEMTLGAAAALAASAERREPSATGHQHRVANIAAAIATELGLDHVAVNGIRIAGQLHDIGKVAIPANILRQAPSIDFSDWELIRTHCQAGYEILAQVSFESPVADMVLQHHECQDGSGYPAGLRGKEILLGARVLAVADTVEDEMARGASHAETDGDFPVAKITAERGLLFDDHVVDACRRLVRENPQFR